MKTPTIGRVWEDLAERARELNWSHEEYLTAVLERQVAERESAGTTMRVRTAHFPQVKTLEEFNLEHLPSLRRDVLAQTGQHDGLEVGKRGHDPAQLDDLGGVRGDAELPLQLDEVGAQVGTHLVGRPGAEGL